MTSINNLIRDIPEVVGAFPRWMAMSQVTNALNHSVGDSISFIIYGVR